MMGAERGQVPTAWLIRAGRRGEREEFALEIGVSGGGWDGLPDLTEVPSRHDLETMLRTLSPDWSNHTVGNYVGQLWMLRSHVGVGDLVVMPLKTTSRIRLGGGDSTILVSGRSGPREAACRVCRLEAYRSAEVRRPFRSSELVGVSSHDLHDCAQ